MAENNTPVELVEGRQLDFRPDLNDILDAYQVPVDPGGTTYWEPSGGLLEAAVSLVTEPIEITVTEANLLDSLGPLDLYDLRNIRNDAQDMANERYPALIERRDDFADDASFQQWGENGGHNDAFRHTLANALMVEHIGAEFAESYATAHEASPGNPANMRAMDLHNNEVGRRIAAENPGASDAELANLVGEAVANGEVIVLDANGDLAWSDAVPYGEHSNGAAPDHNGDVTAQLPSQPSPPPITAAQPPAEAQPPGQALPPATSEPPIIATVAPPADTAPAPQPPAETAPAPQPPAPPQSEPQGPTLGDFFGDADPNDETAGVVTVPPPPAEDLPNINDPLPPEEEEDGQGTGGEGGDGTGGAGGDGTGGAGGDGTGGDGTGGAGNQRPNEDGGGASNGPLDFATFLNPYGPYFNPGSEGGGPQTVSLDLSAFEGPYEPFINPGSDEIALPRGSLDLSVLQEFYDPLINPGLDATGFPGVVDISDVPNINGPRMTPLLDDGVASSATFGGLVSGIDFDFSSDLNDFASFEIA